MPTDLPSDSISVIVRGASLSYRGQPLFDHLDFTIAAGAWTSLLGPSGIGKTSLLRIVAGLESAGAGMVDTSDGVGLGGRVAYMAQRDLLLPWLDLTGNVSIGARLRGERTSSSRARARDYLGMVGLDGREGARPDELSGGERQRAALARTLFEDRPVVLMDEPFSSLDALTRLRVQDLAARLLHGRTVLLVTHDPLEAARLSDRIFLLAGRPAIVQSVDAPGEPAPRTVDSAAVIASQARILDRLARNGVAA